MGRKRNRLHLDRNEILDSKGKKPNISYNVSTSLINNNNKMGSYERHFIHKLEVKNERDYLDAYILHNDICLLFIKEELNNVISIKFNINVEIMSGRRKKGARKIKADTIICDITTNNNEILSYRTPVGGQLLEINENLQNKLDILGNINSGERYIAIIFPDTKIPSPGQSVEEWRAIQESLAIRSNLCYSWVQGKCLRGDKCKFLHSYPENNNDKNNENNGDNVSEELEENNMNLEIEEEEKIKINERVEELE